MTMMQGGDKGNKPNRSFPLFVLGLALVYYLHQLNNSFLNEWLPEIVLAVGVFVYAYTFAPVKEFVRKRLVGLKRKPQTIALVVLVAAFVYYSFNLTNVSDTTAKIQCNGMGLSGFVTMLFSVLSLVCCLNAFPRRKPINIPMLVLMVAMLGAVVFCDIYYGNCITAAITRANNPIATTGENSYIPAVQSMLKTHMIIVIVGVALAVLLPVYAPLIRKINTSVEVEANENMGEIELDNSDE